MDRKWTNTTNVALGPVYNDPAHTHTKIILYYCFEVKHLVKKVVHPLSSGDQQASAMLKIMAQLSPEDLDSVAMAWAAIGAEALGRVSFSWLIIPQRRELCPIVPSGWRTVYGSDGFTFGNSSHRLMAERRLLQSCPQLVPFLEGDARSLRTKKLRGRQKDAESMRTTFAFGCHTN